MEKGGEVFALLLLLSLRHPSRIVKVECFLNRIFNLILYGELTESLSRREMFSLCAFNLRL